MSASLKVEGDPRSVVTRADVEAQDVIVKAVEAAYPNVRIVGEEGAYRPPPVNTTEEEEEEGGGGQPLTLYVDPLDGTREYVLGNVGNVLCLLGLVRGGRPVGGVMRAPFGRAFIGGEGTGGLLEETEAGVYEPFDGPGPYEGPTEACRVCASGSAGVAEAFKALEGMGCTVNVLGGAGNKVSE